MNNPSFIDTLSAIQSSVRDGAKWEYNLNGKWIASPDTDPARRLNEIVELGYKVRLFPEPPKPETPELQPCPFCGGKAAFGTVRYSESTVREQHWKQSEFHSVNCIECGVLNRGIVGHFTQQMAADHWNHRNPCTCAVE